MAQITDSVSKLEVAVQAIDEYGASKSTMLENGETFLHQLADIGESLHKAITELTASPVLERKKLHKALVKQAAVDLRIQEVLDLLAAGDSRCSGLSQSTDSPDKRFREGIQRLRHGIVESRRALAKYGEVLNGIREQAGLPKIPPLVLIPKDDSEPVERVPIREWQSSKSETFVIDSKSTNRFERIAPSQAVTSTDASCPVPVSKDLSRDQIRETIESSKLPSNGRDVLQLSWRLGSTSAQCFVTNFLGMNTIDSDRPPALSSLPLTRQLDIALSFTMLVILVGGIVAYLCRQIRRLPSLHHWTRRMWCSSLSISVQCSAIWVYCLAVSLPLYFQVPVTDKYYFEVTWSSVVFEISTPILAHIVLSPGVITTVYYVTLPPAERNLRAWIWMFTACVVTQLCLDMHLYASRKVPVCIFAMFCSLSTLIVERHRPAFAGDTSESAAKPAAESAAEATAETAIESDATTEAKATQSPEVPPGNTMSTSCLPTAGDGALEGSDSTAIQREGHRRSTWATLGLIILAYCGLVYGTVVEIYVRMQIPADEKLYYEADFEYSLVEISTPLLAYLAMGPLVQACIAARRARLLETLFVLGFTWGWSTSTPRTDEKGSHAAVLRIFWWLYLLLHPPPRPVDRSGPAGPPLVHRSREPRA